MFIARQPIFKRNLEVFGYELLFRGDEDSGQFDGTSSQGATASVIGGLFEAGIEQIVEDKVAFINFDERFVHSNAVELIPPENLIVEMLENIEVDSNLVNRLKELKRKGYKIALDDFVEEIAHYPLVPIADIIKFDLLETPLNKIKPDVEVAKQERKILLAEKVETKAEFEEAKKMGFHLFQGYFFSKPRITSKSNNKVDDKGQYMLLLNELQEEYPSYDKLADIIRNDVNLAYRLMRVSSSRAGEEDLYSIKKALTFMGLNEIERWVHVLMLQDIGKNQPSELTKLALIRSKFAELIVIQCRIPNMRYEASLMGLFSTLDAMLNRPLEKALNEISVPESITDALVHERGPLYPIYKLIIAYEKAEWDKFADLSSEVCLDENKLMEQYLKAIKWANEVFSLAQ